jgi:hypothetical protein
MKMHSSLSLIVQSLSQSSPLIKIGLTSTTWAIICYIHIKCDMLTQPELLKLIRGEQF